MFEVTVKCDECNENCEMDAITHICYECREKTENTLLPMEDVIDKILDDLDPTGEGFVGFKTIEEKTIYMRGFNRGVIQAAYSIECNWDCGFDKKIDQKTEECKIASKNIYWPDDDKR